MNSLKNAINSQNTVTTNGMLAKKTSGNACVDLFYKIGASRGKDIIPDFVSAYVENQEIALRILQWARDVREGAGERELFRQVLVHLANTDPKSSKALIRKIPELGRYDDLLPLLDTELAFAAVEEIRSALNAQNGLCAKWMPRKGALASKLRGLLRMSPKQYRKTLVNLTKVVESQMCNKQWNEINFSQVPSLAAARYRNAFHRNSESFKAYTEALKSGDKSVKVNASAVYPYDVVKSLLFAHVPKMCSTEKDFIVQQWKALPNLIGDASVLPIVDVSGSMTCKAGSSNITCMDVAISLGMYCSEKNTGKFKDLILTFSEHPSLVELKGDVVQRYSQLRNADWGMSTNLEAALNLLLKVAVEGNVPKSEMPAKLLIFSDMQFNQCVEYDVRASEMIARQYRAAGYDVPQIVFWNLHAYENSPVTSTESGVALVSGFSPNILKAILANKLEEFTPEAVMLQTVMIPRYDI